MTLEEFTKICHDVDKSTNEHGQVSSVSRYDFRGENQLEDGKELIYHSYSTGGASGGSCWGSEPSGYTNELSPSDTRLGILDDIFIEVCPTMPFLFYNKILNRAKTNKYTESEYYGNYTDYQEIYFTVEGLYEILKEYGLIK